MIAPTQQRPIQILHLEDSPRDAELIRHKLDALGVSCDIDVASSQAHFKAALSRQAFDLILCDYNLPDYDGLSALAFAKDVCPDAPVIIISGTVGEDEAVKCLHAGATDYLLKQSLERLGSAVSRATQEAEDRRKRRQAEEDLQQRERRMSSIYEAVADILFYLEVENDGRYRFLSVNPAFVAATGLNYDDVVGRCLDEIVSEPSLSVILGNYDKAIREKRVVRWEDTSDYPNGRLTGEVSISPVFDASGTCTHLVGAFHNFTERRQLEAQLRQAQKMESVGQLAGGIAHDFNNLLTVINGMSELVLAQVKEGAPQLQEDVQEIRRAGERAAALTRQLLAFSRKQILQPQIIDLDAVVREMGSMLRRLLGEDVELVITPAPSPATVKADRGQIEQVIANLAVNARDAMPHGGKLTIATRHEAIDVPHRQPDDTSLEAGKYAVLSISDTGSGMDETTRRQIFEPFFTTKGPGKGTGLGLSTVFGIVRQSGGAISVDSEVGKGTCFSIYLPSATEATEEAPVLADAAPTSAAETVLVVEDVAALRRLITRTLESAGYNVLTAASGEEALQSLEQYPKPVHLMITDVVMSGMSGRSLAEQLHQIRPEMKVLYMSGYTDDVIVRHGVLEGEMPFVNKPFGTAELVRAIRETLDGTNHGL